MPYPAPGFTTDETAERRETGPIVRTLLAGSFAAPGSGARPAIEAMFAQQTSGLAHRLVPGSQDFEPGALAEVTLAANEVDLVLLDLDGPVADVLALVGRLRAAAGGSVVFVGIMPRDASQASRLYLPAVLDAVVHGPLRSAGLIWAVTDALQSMLVAVADLRSAVIAGLPTRH